MSSSSAGSVGAGGSAGERLTDAQVFRVLDNVHAGKIAESEMASARASNVDVIAFATSVGAAHQQAAAELSALQQLSAMPMDSTLSLTVAATSRVEVDNLTGAAAASFDETYLQGQIAGHSRLVPLLATLQGMATDPKLRDGVKALLSLSNEHHSDAIKLVTAL